MAMRIMSVQQWDDGVAVLPQSLKATASLKKKIHKI